MKEIKLSNVQIIAEIMTLLSRVSSYLKKFPASDHRLKSEINFTSNTFLNYRFCYDFLILFVIFNLWYNLLQVILTFIFLGKSVWELR